MFARLFLAGLLLNSIVNGQNCPGQVLNCGKPLKSTYEGSDLRLKPCFENFYEDFPGPSIVDCENCVRNKLRRSVPIAKPNHVAIRKLCEKEFDFALALS